MARKPTDTVKLQLRLSESLRRRLEKLAKHNARSMNSEIIVLLADAVRVKEAVIEMNRIVEADEPPPPDHPWFRSWQLHRLDLDGPPPEDPELRSFWEQTRKEREILRSRSKDESK
jgi:hypothetical protein